MLIAICDNCFTKIAIFNYITNILVIFLLYISLYNHLTKDHIKLISNPSSL